MSWSSPFEYSDAVEHHAVLDLKAGEIPTWSDSYSDSEEVDAVTERIDSEPDRYADIEPPDSSEQWQWTAARHLRHPAQHAVPTVMCGTPTVVRGACSRASGPGRGHGGTLVRHVIGRMPPADRSWFECGPWDTSSDRRSTSVTVFG